MFLTTENYASVIGQRIAAERLTLSALWLARLRELLTVTPNEVFPSERLLDHIPLLVDQIAGYLSAPQEEEIAANAAVISDSTSAKRAGDNVLSFWSKDFSAWAFMNAILPDPMGRCRPWRRNPRKIGSRRGHVRPVRAGHRARAATSDLRADAGLRALGFLSAAGVFARCRTVG